MGYTHYWWIYDFDAWQKVFPLLLDEVPMIVEAADVPVKLHYVLGQDTQIDHFCLEGTGDDNHEAFVVVASSSAHEPSINFTKTNQKPYDLTVCVVLLRMQSLLSKGLKVSSDGHWEREWKKPRILYSQLWPQEPLRCPWSDEFTQASLIQHRPLWVTPSTSQSILSPEHNEIISPAQNYGQINLHLIRRFIHGARQLLDTCVLESASHNACIPTPLEWPNIPGAIFRLIDCEERCVIKGLQRCEYVTLSYVWGACSQVELNDMTMSRLLQKRSLDNDAGNASRTVLQAIEVCKLLGQRYLWVDALCIKQDSSRDRLFQILRMRQIYAGSYITLIAAAGSDADCSLLSEENHCEKTTPTAETIYDGSVWPTRAWTYQEDVLSHRQLIFAKAGVFFKCRAATWMLYPALRDLTPASTQGCFQQNLGSSFTCQPGSQLEAYYEAVSNYSGRKLSRQEDALSAFHGILKSFGDVLDRQANRFHHGLPTSLFDQAFCWQTEHHAPHLRRWDFPSWSWLGWQQKVFWEAQHRPVALEKRTARLLWPQFSEQEWNNFGKFCLQKNAEADYMVYPEAAHQYSGTKLCCYRNGLMDLFEHGPTSGWGLPSTDIIYCHGGCLRLVGSIALLKVIEAVAEQAVDKQIDSNTHYLVTSMDECCVFGTIKLDRTWRQTRPDHLNFLLLDGIFLEDVLIGTHLMCLDYYGDRHQKSGDSIFVDATRVGVMTCRIREAEWTKGGARAAVINMY